MKKQSKKYWKLGTIFILLGCISLGVYIYKWKYREPLFEIYFFSLNRGRAIFIRTPKNKTILIGGGQNSQVISEITKVMPFYDRKIDFFVVPSAMPTQIGGLIEVIDRYEIGQIIIPKIMATSTVLTILLKEIKKNKIHVEKVERGDKIEIGKQNEWEKQGKYEKSVLLRVLFPYKGFKFNKTSLPELGMSISYGSTTVYLLGNLSKTIQKDILKSMNLNITANNDLVEGNVIENDIDNKVKDNEKSQDDESQNIVEYYNSAIESKVYSDLLERIDPKFIFSTKEKTTHMISDGESWWRE